MSLFRKPSELEVTATIKALIYGSPGIGKSTAALSAPSPVLFDFDGGVQRVNGAFQVPTLQVKNWEEVVQALAELKANAVECKTIVIDTAGKMLDYMGDYIMRNDSKMRMRDGSLSLKGYGARKIMFINFLKEVSLMGKHIVFVAHEREDKDGELRIVRPEIGGSSANDLIKELDLVGYMQAIGKDRTIFWSPQEKFYAKNACNLPESVKIPVVLDSSGNVIADNTFLTTVFEAYHKYLGEIRKKRSSYDNLLSSFIKGIESVEDADAANDVYTKIENYGKHVWDSKAQAEKRLEIKCHTLGLKFNAINNMYETA